MVNGCCPSTSAAIGGAIGTANHRAGGQTTSGRCAGRGGEHVRVGFGVVRGERLRGLSRAHRTVAGSAARVRSRR